MSLLRHPPEPAGRGTQALRAARRRLYREMIVNSNQADLHAAAVYFQRVGCRFTALALEHRAEQIALQEKQQREILDFVETVP